MYKVTCRRNTPLSSALFPSISSLWTLPRGNEESVSKAKNEGKDEERRGKEGKKEKKKKAPVERNLVSRRSGGETAKEWGRGAARGRERAGVGDPDVLIKRLIFIARQKREFNAHRRLMRRPTAARG